jgi:hypothetical protein
MQEVTAMDTAEELIRRECGVWDELQAVPAYCERFVADELVAVIIIQCDEITHTDIHPFCDDPACGCHDDVELIQEHLERPFDAGLLTEPEKLRIKEGWQL